MTRRLLNFLTALSLLLCVAVVALWVWSYWGPVEWAHLPSPGSNWLFETRGINGEYYVGWWNHGIAFPCYLPFLLLIVWPCVDAALRWKRLRRRRGYPIDV